MIGRGVLAFLLVWLLAATAAAQSLRIADRQTREDRERGSAARRSGDTHRHDRATRSIGGR